jgi:F-type H+-transporting ATPase subunit a
VKANFLNILSKSLIVLSIFVVQSVSCFASEESHSESKKFNAGEMIIHHIVDAHEWHIAEFGHTHITVPLPIILLNEGSLKIFLSNKLESSTVEGVKEYGNFTYSHGHFEAKNGSKVYDFSITKNTAAMMISVSIILLIFISIANSYKKNVGKAPKGLQSALEPIIVFVRDDIAKASIGKKYEKYMPFLLTVFFFIWLNNLLGLIPIFPGGANVTGSISIALVLSLFTFLITTFSGNKTYWSHIFLPDVPKALYVLLIPIEIIGMFLKPFVLMVRLFANITAGHIIILGFFSLIFIFGEMNAGLGYGVSTFSVAFTLFMSFLELLVAFLQAYVFTLLSALYFGSAVEEHAHNDHHHEHHV